MGNSLESFFFVDEIQLLAYENTFSDDIQLERLTNTESSIF